MLETAIRLFSKEYFVPKAELDVKFVGEDGIDNGGLSREYLTLVLRAIRDSYMFHGPEQHKTLVLHASGNSLFVFLASLNSS